MEHHEVLDRILDTRDCTAGGGSAAALAGAMAAGLAGMVARLSLGKAWGLADASYLALAERAEALAPALAQGAARDSAAYLKIKQAYALSKASPGEQLARSQAIQQAGIAAATVPLENAGHCRAVHRLCLDLAGRANPAAGSDLAVAEQLSLAGLEGCVRNIEANLPLIKDGAIRARFERRAAELRTLPLAPETGSQP